MPPCATHELRAGWAATAGRRGHQAACQRCGAPSERRARPSASSVSRITGRRSRQRPRALKRASRSASASGRGLRGQHLGHGLDLLRQAGGPGRAWPRRGGGRRRARLRPRRRRHVRCAGLRAAARALLEVGPQPAHRAGGFFGGALGVQRHQAFEQRLHRRGARLGRGRRVVGQRAPAGRPSRRPAAPRRRVRRAACAAPPTRPCSCSSLSLAFSGSPVRSLASTLYRPVSVTSSCAAWRALRWASSCSARLRMRSASAGVRPVSSEGKGKGSKQRGLVVDAGRCLRRAARQRQCPFARALRSTVRRGCSASSRRNRDELVVRQHVASMNTKIRCFAVSAVAM